jgi:integrase
MPESEFLLKALILQVIVPIAPDWRATLTLQSRHYFDHWSVARRPPVMKQKPSSRRKRRSAKSVLRLPDLEHAKAAVLNSLNSMDAKRGYRHAIDEFVDWYCSEPRLAFNRIVVLRYRSHLESRQLAPGTINLRLGAVRRLAYEAADCGLLSADLAAGIRRVKGVKKLGVRLGNWLTAEQGNALWQAPDRERLKGKRDRALLALLLACGLRRHEAVALTLDHLQQREEHWAIVDLVAREATCERFRFPIGWEQNSTIGSRQPPLIEEECSAGSTR